MLGDWCCGCESSYYEKHYKAQIRATAQKQIKVTANQPTEEENDVDNLSYGSRYASRKTSIGHAGRRAMRSPSPMVIAIPAIATLAFFFLFFFNAWFVKSS